MRIARLRGGQESREGVRASQLRHSITELAVMVWLTRTATADGLKRALAEGTYFGRHAYGIKAARTAYYGCSASALATAQVAFLVGLVQNPSGLNPVAHPDRAAKRRQYILKSLADAGVILRCRLRLSLNVAAKYTGTVGQFWTGAGPIWATQAHAGPR